MLAPFLIDPAKEFVKKVRIDLGVNLFIVFTWRSATEQRNIFTQGREFSREEGIWKVTNKKLVKTDADAGSSAHNVSQPDLKPASLALDVIPMIDTALLWGYPTEGWKKIWAIAWDFGLDPLGDEIGAFYQGDLGHLEEPAWRLKMAGLGLVLPKLEKPEEV